MKRDKTNRFEIDAAYLNALRQKLGATSNQEVTEEALALLEWVVGEIEQGRLVLSSEHDGTQVRRLETPYLRRVSRTAA